MALGKTSKKARDVEKRTGNKSGTGEKKIDKSSGNKGGSYGGGGSGGGGTSIGGGGSTTVGGGGGEAAKAASLAKSRFGKSVAPEAYGQAWDNPEAVIRAWFNQNRIPVNTGAEAMAQELQPSLGIQFLASQNGGNDPNAVDTPAFLDWVDHTLGQYGKAGGSVLGPGQMLGALLHPGDNSILGDHLTSANLTPSDQVTNMLSAARYGLAPTLPTPVLNAILNRIDSEGKDYQAQMLHDPNGAMKNFPMLLAQDGIFGRGM